MNGNPRDRGFQFVFFFSGGTSGQVIPQKGQTIQFDIDNVSETQHNEKETICFQLTSFIQQQLCIGKNISEQQRELLVDFSADVKGKQKFLYAGVKVVRCIFQSVDAYHGENGMGYCLRIPSGYRSPPYIAVIRETFSDPKPPMSWISINGTTVPSKENSCRMRLQEGSPELMAMNNPEKTERPCNIELGDDGSITISFRYNYNFFDSWSLKVLLRSGTCIQYQVDPV
eukprot:GHVU01212964.1.p1 GENE.GHVU01212964.1~~GHVU01212964.1.p1  ORF type:complete len:228 (-),score=9.10 GHVU01212964.1:731-1414(-)